MKASREAIPLFYSISVCKEPGICVCFFLTFLFCVQVKFYKYLIPTKMPNCILIPVLRNIF